MHLKTIPATMWRVTLVVLTLTVFALAACESHLAGTMMLIASLSTIVAAPRTPASSAVAAIFLTIAVSSFSGLGSILTPVTLGIVAGVLGYKGHLLGGVAYAIAAEFFGTIDLEHKQFIPDSLIGSVLLGVFIFAPLVGGYVQGVRESTHEAERIRYETAMQRHRQATIQTLHDSVARALTSSVLQAEGLALEPNISPTLREKLRFISKENRNAITQVRELIHVLDSSDTEDALLEVPTTFEKQLEEFAALLRSHDFQVEVTNSGLTPKLLASVPTFTTPIMIELASNISKYGAPGSTVHVDVSATDNTLLVEVRNRLGNAQSQSYLSTGLGLTEIHKEVTDHHGSFSCGPDGDEWISRWTIPLKKRPFSTQR